MTAHRPAFERALPPTMPVADATPSRGGLALAVAPPTAAPAPGRDRERLPRLLRLRTWAVVASVVATVLVGAAVWTVLAPAAGGSAALDPGRATPDALPAGATPFGVPFTYADGLVVEVAPPVPFTPSRNAAGGDGNAAVLLEVTITNGTERTYRASTLEVVAASGGFEAAQVWDPDQAVELSGPTFAVPPGGAVQFRVGFTVQQPDDVRLTVVPALYGYEGLVVGDV